MHKISDKKLAEYTKILRKIKGGVKIFTQQEISEYLHCSRKNINDFLKM